MYFDESEYECDDSINIRFDVHTETLYAELFSHLDNIGIKRSAYLRNLIHEYFNQSEYQKERICFNDEYNALVTALSDETIVQFNYDKKTVTALVAALEYSVKTEHWYLLFFIKDEYDRLYSIPLFKISNILLRHKSDTLPDDPTSEQINTLIESGVFDSSDIFILGGEHNA